MKLKLIFGGMLLSGIATAVLRRRSSNSYNQDEIDSAGPGAFGDRDELAPEQRWAPATTRQDVTPEELSMAARVETALDEIKSAFPTVTAEEIRHNARSLDQLAHVIAEKSGQPQTQVRTRLDAIIATVVPDASYPGH